MENPQILLTLSQVQNRVPYSSTHIWRLERVGQFPKRIKLGPNRVGWLESEVNAWIEGKAFARNAANDEGES